MPMRAVLHLAETRFLNACAVPLTGMAAACSLYLEIVDYISGRSSRPPRKPGQSARFFLGVCNREARSVMVKFLLASYRWSDPREACRTAHTWTSSRLRGQVGLPVFQKAELSVISMVEGMSLRNANFMCLEIASVILSSPAVASTVPKVGQLSCLTLDRVTGFIDSHLFDPVTLEDLAKVALLSRFHFSRRFQVTTGESPMSYLQRCRIERAKVLLRAGEHTVSEIATRLVFADHSHFARVFRRIAGCSPSAFARYGEAEPRCSPT
jgi:AraC-like DNA-binding protein